MKFTRLGRTGLQVSRLCLGTMNFSGRTSEEDSFRIMDAALELGINFFDTANVALAWMLRTPGLTGPIIGPATLEQLTGCTRCLDLTLDARTLERLDEIWPGPGGEAPEAYAW